MTAIRRIPRKNRLKEIVSRPGGLTVGQALRAAEAKLQSLHGEGVQAIDELLEQIHRIVAAVSDAPGEEAMETVYRLSDQVHCIAGTFGLEELGAAAHSLCDLLDRQLTANKPNAAAIAVHLDGLRLLRGQDGGATGREAMLEGLRRVAERG